MAPLIFCNAILQKVVLTPITYIKIKFDIWAFIYTTIENLKKHQRYKWKKIVFDFDEIQLMQSLWPNDFTQKVWVKLEAKPFSDSKGKETFNDFLTIRKISSEKQFFCLPSNKYLWVTPWIFVKKWGRQNMSLEKMYFALWMYTKAEEKEFLKFYIGLSSCNLLCTARLAHLAGIYGAVFSLFIEQNIFFLETCFAYTISGPKFTVWWLLFSGN